MFHPLNIAMRIMICIIVICCMGCNENKVENCPSKNGRKMDLIGVDKCGCLYGVPATHTNPDSVVRGNGVMWTVDREPCL